MFNINDYAISHTIARAGQQPGSGGLAPIRSALKLYDRARSRGCLHRLWYSLTRRRTQLLDLEQIEASGTVHDRCYAGIQTVPLGQIGGSSGRCHDFDSAFYPRQNHNKGRWLNIAVARLMGAPLPPVHLVQVGDLYFVQDGHHRISVARALGQACIEAEVMAWQVAGPLPWQRPAFTLDQIPAQRQQTIEPAQSY
jgi:hypothetical protein